MDPHADLVAPSGAHFLRPPPRLRRPQFVAAVPVDPSGTVGPTRGQARGRQWRRTAAGLCVPTAAVFDQPAQRIVEASALAGPIGGVTGWASLHLAGARWFEGSDHLGRALPVQVCVGPLRQCAARDRIVFARNRVATSEIVWRYGVPCLNIHRSLFDEVVRRGTAQAGAAAIDMVLYAELTSLRRFTAWLGTVRDVPGVPLVRRAVALSVEGVESPQESRLRFAWMFGAGLPEPLCNMDVHSTSGAFLARPDLFSPELGLIGEYDGEVHSGAAARGHDHTRVDRLRDHGLEVVSVVGGQLDEREVVKRLRAAARRAQRSQVERDWVLHGPNGPRPPLDWRIDARLSWLSSKRRELQLRDMPGPM